LLEITGGVVHSCTCPAGQHGDPVRTHRAQGCYNAGLLDFDVDAPEPPATTHAAPVACWVCCGTGTAEGTPARTCPTCRGIGTAPLVAQAATLRAASGGSDDDGTRVEYVGRPHSRLRRVDHGGHADHSARDEWPALAAHRPELRHAPQGPPTGPGFRIGWAVFPDDHEHLYVYDRDDSFFGYAFNLSDPALSEWGYAPFTSSEATLAA
jgi:hypothetical protein